MQTEPNGSSLKGQTGSKLKKTEVAVANAFRGFETLVELKEDTEFQNDFSFCRWIGCNDVCNHKGVV